MSSFSVDEVARLAGLARIRLTEGEIERMAGELDVIASAVAKVDRDEVLAAAPASEDGKFLVPQILGEE